MSMCRRLSVLVGGLILGIGCALPAAAQPMTGAFVVYHSPYDAKNPVTVWSADCKGLNPKLSKQSTTCTLTQETCKPCYSVDTAKCKADKDVCNFVISSTDGPPATLVFGASTGSHCIWVWDKYAMTYVKKCFPVPPFPPH